MLILASSSPRRREILSIYIKDYKIVVPNIDESLLHANPADLPLQESKAKAYDVFSSHPNDDILACDTVVILDNAVLGKPKDENEAIAMLKREQGRKQIVVSGYSFINATKEINRSVATEVYFNDLTEDQIEEYVRTKKPLDKAGAYGIQDGFDLVKEIRGSYYNVMGLPIEDIMKHVFNREI